jgi:hypothetical protein
MKEGLTRTLVIGCFAAGAVLWMALPVLSEDYGDAAALAKAMSSAKVSLDKGLKASEREGKPISGKYEVENGALQLSVYTAKAGKFSEVIVDHKSGSIKKAEPITDKEDLEHAKAQSAAMAKAKVPLNQVVAGAVRANSGYRAVSAIPTEQEGHPVAEITLMKGTETKKVTTKLD